MAIVLVIFGVLAVLLSTLIFIINHCMKKINVSGNVNIEKSHFLITGGSKGIGRALALNLVPYGCKVTIIARGINELHETLNDLKSLTPEIDKVSYAVLDITSNINLIKKTVDDIIEQSGPIDVLINCAGLSIPSTIEELDTDTMMKLYDINVIGSVKLVQAVLPSMKQKKFGQIVFISSVAGQFGLYGFSAYSASKFALRGVAESLSMELKPYNIGITVIYPPDTDTPGFANENCHKPIITKKISEYGGLVKPEDVAISIIKAIRNRQYSISINFDGFITNIISEGCCPPTSIVYSLCHFFFSGIFRIAFMLYLGIFNSIVEKN